MIYRLHILAFLFVNVCSISVSAQSPKYRVISIPVEKNTIDLREPWVGGMNSAQFSSINLNNDNLPDLFVFDKVGDKVLTYLNNGNGTDSTFTYAPQYERLFPFDLFSWAVIRDYNHDNIPDIFTHANTGSRVYKGSYQNGLLHFDLVSDLLKFKSGAFTVNIWTSLDDIPVFTDVNFDGDIDVLSYGITGTQVEYYENQTKEHSGDIHYDVDSFQFEEVSLCWGNFAQNSLSNSISLNISCKGGGRTYDEVGESRHSGNTLFAFDDGNDHDIDLLNGNIGYDNLAFMENCEDSSYANICAWDSLFPICNRSVVMPTYPAAFGADVNNDGLEDLLISPNTRAGGRDVKNVMLYKNVNNQLCNFEFQKDSFIVEHMLDFGTDSKPVFFDFNGDGLQDIMVGNFGYFRPFQTYRSTLAYLENIGTTSNPSFRFRDDNYGNFSSYNLVGIHPAFGDLDGDGKQDLLVGELTGFLHFFKNMGNTVASFPSMTTPQFDTLDVGQYSAPLIYDVNGDSLNDLVVGKKDGKLSYFWNMGTKTNPHFHQDSVNASFGNINVTVPGYTEGYSQPFIMKDASGTMQLFVGSNQGRIFQYQIDTAKLRSGIFNVIDADIIKQPVGTKATIYITDLNNDSNLEYLMGNSRGGLLMYSDANCSAHFNLYSDTTPHYYYAVNMATGVAPLSYSWSWGDGSYDSVAYPSHIYTTAGFYTICLTVTDSTGCSNTYCNDFSLLRGASTMVYVNVIPQANNISEESLPDESLLVYPNPASGYFICAPQNSQFVNPKIEVYNILGDKMKTDMKMESGKIVIKTSSLSKGLYLVRISDAGKSFHGKVLVQH